MLGADGLGVANHDLGRAEAGCIGLAGCGVEQFALRPGALRHQPEGMGRVGEHRLHVHRRNDERIGPRDYVLLTLLLRRRRLDRRRQACQFADVVETEVRA